MVILIESGVELSPDEQKDEIKLDAAKRISSAYLGFAIDDGTEEGLYDRLALISCLEFAHGFAPNNEGIIIRLYHHPRIFALQLRLLNLDFESHSDDFFDGIDELEEMSVAGYNRKAEAYLAKLRELNPAEADRIASEEKREKERTQAILESGGGSGCLVAIIIFLCCTIIVSLFVL